MPIKKKSKSPRSSKSSSNRRSNRRSKSSSKSSSNRSLNERSKKINEVKGKIDKVIKKINEVLNKEKNEVLKKKKEKNEFSEIIAVFEKLIKKLDLSKPIRFKDLLDIETMIELIKIEKIDLKFKLLFETIEKIDYINTDYDIFINSINKLLNEKFTNFSKKNSKSKSKTPKSKTLKSKTPTSKTSTSKTSNSKTLKIITGGNKDEKTCPICLDKYNEEVVNESNVDNKKVLIPDCGFNHAFCLSCLKKLFVTNRINNCPICRERIRTVDMTQWPNKAFDNNPAVKQKFIDKENRDRRRQNIYDALEQYKDIIEAVAGVTTFAVVLNSVPIHPIFKYIAGYSLFFLAMLSVQIYFF